MSLHHGLTDPCDNHFTDSSIFSWFQASSQASLRFCLRAKLTSKLPQMRKMMRLYHNVTVILLNTVQDLTNLQFGLDHYAPTKTNFAMFRMFAAGLSNSHKATVRQASCAFWSLELHISYGRSSHMTCTAAWTFHACHRQHMLAEAVYEAGP